MLYHRTIFNNAKAILNIGFIDSTASYMAIGEFTGVWFSNIPLDVNQGADGDTLLQIEFDF